MVDEGVSFRKARKQPYTEKDSVTELRMIWRLKETDSPCMSSHPDSSEVVTKGRKIIKFYDDEKSQFGISRLYYISNTYLKIDHDLLHLQLFRFVGWILLATSHWTASRKVARISQPRDLWTSIGVFMLLKSLLHCAWRTVCRPTIVIQRTVTGDHTS
jgi:hypothetical protein